MKNYNEHFDNKYSFEEYLNQYGILTYKNKGISMLPMLRENRDLFTVVKKGSKRCEKYDVVLYRRPPDQYVLHRIVEVRDKDYVILGDNCINKEYGICEEDILGVLTSFSHRGTEYKVTDWKYRIYSRVRYGTYPIRKLWWKLKQMYARMKEMIYRLIPLFCVIIMTTL